MIDPGEKENLPFDEVGPTEEDLKSINEIHLPHINFFEDLDEIDDYGWAD